MYLMVRANFSPSVIDPWQGSKEEKTWTLKMGEVLLKGSKTTISPFLFKKLREEGEFFDVTLVPGNETFGGTHVNAHKVILSAFSPVFKNMLRGTPHTVTPP
ncbi:unnamed protein product [Lepeophtheirus salmonis]|uniref:(salmon louse) hypothetical protein n=1 Tax=Lepeophtheirus salmonis TaxID=72036 RepID=A0A7R8CIB8_LEPSM|nr:unnamed protein product [Lepeophtheirus salmonis]CAF2830924.1 unnamed protein product [Lepeophtheirus salmonis]